MTKQLTREQAVELHESKFWEGMSHRERAVFQMEQDRLCMPFSVFHEAVEAALGRPVFTSELGLNSEGLLREILRTPSGGDATSVRTC